MDEACCRISRAQQLTRSAHAAPNAPLRGGVEGGGHARYIPITATLQDQAYPMPDFNPTVYSPPCMRPDGAHMHVVGSNPANLSVYHPI